MNYAFQQDTTVATAPTTPASPTINRGATAWKSALNNSRRSADSSLAWNLFAFKPSRTRSGPSRSNIDLIRSFGVRGMVIWYLVNFDQLILAPLAQITAAAQFRKGARHG